MKDMMKEELKRYVGGQVRYMHNMSILMGSDRKYDPFAKLGEYIVKEFNGKLPPDLKFYEERLKKSSTIIKKINVFRDELEDTYSSIAIFFITGTLGEDSLKKIFGEPICHSEFGEGPDEPDEYDDKKLIISFPKYASYFVEIEGVKLHIGYDHRGTSIEALEGTSSDDLLKALKKLVDIYKQKVK